MRPTSSPGHRFDVRLTGDLRAVRGVREALGEFCRSRGVGERTIDEILLAVTEACDNAFEHAGAGPVGVRVLAVVRADRILVRVIGGAVRHLPSLARAYDASSVLPPEDGERGRGLFLVRAYVDRVGVRAQGGEIEVRMTKRRRRERAG